MDGVSGQPRILSQAEGSVLLGDWTTARLTQWLQLEKRLNKLAVSELRLECGQMDTNGALVFMKLFGNNPDHWPQGLTTEQQALLELVDKRQAKVPKQTRLNTLADLGYRTLNSLRHGRELLDFLGRLTLALLNLLRHPQRLKAKLVLDVIQRDGLHAVPIIALMGFLLGAVVAWQGGLQLKTYGANIFIVELVAITHLRELGPLIAAILVAGRSGSAYAAQIATMNMNQEVLALKSLGQDPYAWLVIPKLLGLLIVLPLLTVMANLAGLGGGMLVASVQLDVSPTAFWNRLGDEIDVAHYWIGLVKAPVFALIIVTVGCMQGMLARGGAEAVGHRTTRSVVQAIFLVIVTDAVFSIIFSNIGW
ncbi:phospholipid/cholesterol/gamma-HCH transport system permease protein [Marinospirillum celere]|uniref:Phospholipid/cholesterol/gamma-HCH transport system permease protein n=1 Tax=Marinospirillum celere TaxID=1122252 RepID=A0A1I1EFF8_9GAMM|nr:ABC transporter permease [Marinospirillum celere]SFB85904.1 phospholipid/cholesterol/gamma-HCH transport system permease protein [Marinospirillum celere]